MQIKTQAIVISSIKYRDTDLIVKCYTQEIGSLSFMVKGVLKSKKGKFRNSHFQTLSIIDVEFFYRNKGQLEYFKDIQTAHHLYTIQTNVYKTSIAMFLSEILKAVIIEEEQNDKLFIFIKQSILHLENTDTFANFHLSFLLKLTSFLGFYPQIDESSNDPYFNLIEGTFQSIENQFTVSQTHSTILESFLSFALTENHKIKISKEERQSMLNIILSYYELHVENFKEPKSLEVIKSLFI